MTGIPGFGGNFLERPRNINALSGRSRSSPCPVINAGAELIHDLAMK